MNYFLGRKKEYRKLRRGLIDPQIPQDKNEDPIVIVEEVITEPDDIPKVNKKKTKGKNKYYELVWGLTRSVNKEDIEGFDSEMVITRFKILSEGRGILQSDTLLVIDHKISISYGFKNNIPPDHIAHPSNLRYIPSKTNSRKNAGNYIDSGNSWILKNI